MRSSSRIEGLGVIRPTLILVVFVIIGIFATKSQRKGRSLSKQDGSNILWILFAYVIISLPFVAYPGSVLKVNIAEWIKASVFFFFTVALIDNKHKLKILMLVFSLTQVFRVLEPLYLNITNGYTGGKTYLGGGEFYGRLAGSPYDVINPNELGFVIVYTMTFLIFYFKKDSVTKKLFLALVFVAFFYALMLTMSRGAFLVMILLTWIVFKKSKYKSLVALVVIAGAMIMWTQMDSTQKARYTSIFGESEFSKSREGRINGMIKEFELGFKKPLFGHGLGTTPEVKFHTLGKKQASHNMYAELLIETGIIGVGLFIYYIVIVRRKLQSFANIDSDDDAQRIHKTLNAMFWIFVFYSINYWGLSQFYWYFLGGLSFAAANIFLPEKTQESILKKTFNIPRNIHNR